MSRLPPPTSSGVWRSFSTISLLGTGNPGTNRRRPRFDHRQLRYQGSTRSRRSFCARAPCRRRWRSSKSARSVRRWASDSINQGITSFVVGGVSGDLFMIAYYKGAGLVADVALIFNILFMMAVLAGFQAVLTLPGIAGIVLTHRHGGGCQRADQRAHPRGATGRATRRDRLSKPAIKMPCPPSWIPTSRLFFPA